MSKIAFEWSKSDLHIKTVLHQYHHPSDKLQSDLLVSFGFISFNFRVCEILSQKWKEMKSVWSLAFIQYRENVIQGPVDNFIKYSWLGSIEWTLPPNSNWIDT